MAKSIEERLQYLEDVLLSLRHDYNRLDIRTGGLRLEVEENYKHVHRIMEWLGLYKYNVPKN